MSLLGQLADVYVPVWSLLLWVVLLGTLVPFAVELAALGHLRATTVTMIAMIEPVGVSALGWLWFYESLDAVALSAGSLWWPGHRWLAQSARRARVLWPPHL